MTRQNRENFFHLLEIPYDVTNTDEIKRKITQKQQEWSRQKNHPLYGKDFAENLRLIPKIREVMLTSARRQIEAADAERIDEEKKQKLYADLDQAIEIAATKGWIDQREVKQMTKQFNVSLDVVKSRISFPVESRTIEKNRPKTQQMNTARAKDIAEKCEQLGVKTRHVSKIASIYDYLVVRETTSLKTLSEKATDRYDQVARKKRSFINELEKDLSSRAQVIFRSEADKKQYDAELAAYRLEKLSEYIQIAGATKQILPEVAEALKKKAMSFGHLTEQEAHEYIVEQCHRNDIELVTTSENTNTLNVTHCGLCGFVQRTTDQYCTNCGTDLNITCPSCQHQTTTADQACRMCGFELRFIRYIPQQLQSAELAIKQQQFEQAKKHITLILTWWPKHREATKLLQTIEAQEAKTARKIKQITELIEKRHLYAARTLFVQEKQLVQSSPSLQNMEQQCLQQIQLAERLLVQAEQSNHEEEKISYYLQALDIAADCQTANEKLTHWPPVSATNLQLESQNDHITLKWQKSTSKGPITYRILRKENEPSKHPQDGEILQETTNHSFVDNSAIGGIAYYYTVYTLRGSVTAKQSITKGPIIRKAEVTQVMSQQTDRHIQLTWNVPKGAQAVEVWKKVGAIPVGRNDGERLELVTNTRVIDSDVQFGQQYGYRIIVIYDINGERHYSTGQTMTCEMTAIPAAIKHMTAKRETEGIFLEWEVNPDANQSFDLFYSYERPNLPSKLPLSKRASLGTKIERSSEAKSAFLDVSMNRPVYIISVTHAAEMAHIGQILVSKDQPEVSHLTHRIAEETNELVLQWDWPENVTEVIVAYAHDHYPVHPDDPDAFMTQLTKGTYEALNGYKLSMNKQDYYFSIFTRFSENGTPTYSNGAKYLIVQQDPITLTYDLKVSNMWFNKRIILSIEADESTYLPALILTQAKKFPPTARENGQDIYRISETKKSHSFNIEIPTQYIERDHYARLFFTNELDHQKYRLQPKDGKQSLQLW
ncbi:MAG TPA: hypothetical protein VK079_03465 [Bacillota bacterium]|nr:hypothetical protein [Bacillota bacterium]